MKMQRNSLLIMFFVTFALTVAFGTSNVAYAQDGSTYGHISYVDKEATVVREDQTEHKAVVNMPVVPGDHIVTSDKGRCELQFNNGTVIRLDKNTRLKVTTVLAPSLTSRWKVTTLHLLTGKIFSMNQSYNREMFQVITPNAALHLKKRSSSAIQVKNNGETNVFVDKGKVYALFGKDVENAETKTIKSGNAYNITADHQLKPATEKRSVDFVAWNKYVTRNHKELHQGISKVPKKLLRGNTALTYWAEKWSSSFGEWVYDELFGYVWRPYDEIFAYSKRPFFHADFVRINGKMHIVPQQPWGWAPAHMGTWVWTKRGWTWIPGTAFHTGMSPITRMYSGGFYYPTFGYWIHRCYGSYDLYYTYRRYGARAWRTAYKKVYNRDVKNPDLKTIPGSIRTIFKKVNKAPIKVLKERLGSNRPTPTINVKNIKHNLRIRKIDGRTRIDRRTGVKIDPTAVRTTGRRISSNATVKNNRNSDRKVVDMREKMRKRGGIKRTGAALRHTGVKNFRDLNPDVRWAVRTGTKIIYNSRTNEVVAPKLKMSSRSLTSKQRTSINRMSRTAVRTSKKGYFNRTSGSSSSSNSSSASSSSTNSSSSSRTYVDRRTGATSTRSSGSTTAKKK